MTRAEAQRRYRQTPQGKATQKRANERYRKTARGKEAQRRAEAKYEASEKAKEKHRLWRASDAGKQWERTNSRGRKNGLRSYRAIRQAYELGVLSDQELVDMTS